MSDHNTIRQAWLANQKLRPFKVHDDVLRAITPPGGEWNAAAPDGAIARSVMWNSMEVCQVNPQGQLADDVEGDITMGLRATPVLDTALRTIMTLAADPTNAPLIAKIAETAIAYVEMPAPRIKEPEDDEADEDELDEDSF
jgi:hypothetical protein